ncbi:hypothetical protein [Brevibacillus massiliensis]|jgi:hypothetical protein|uniref:hypothetical protein n=1 Tax=Brevibacillus massiliensis TaxID=1118054 RepID=UPI0002DDB5DC|nr:hypothetical protein [Brevibacillus massiliensis]
MSFGAIVIEWNNLILQAAIMLILIVMAIGIAVLFSKKLGGRQGKAQELEAGSETIEQEHRK